MYGYILQIIFRLSADYIYKSFFFFYKCSSYNARYRLEKTTLYSHKLILKHCISGPNHSLYWPALVWVSLNTSSSSSKHLTKLPSPIEHEDVQKAISPVVKCPLSFSFTIYLFAYFTLKLYSRHYTSWANVMWSSKMSLLSWKAFCF